MTDYQIIAAIRRWLGWQVRTRRSYISLLIGTAWMAINTGFYLGIESRHFVVWMGLSLFAIIGYLAAETEDS